MGAWLNYGAGGQFGETFNLMYGGSSVILGKAYAFQMGARIASAVNVQLFSKTKPRVVGSDPAGRSVSISSQQGSFTTSKYPSLSILLDVPCRT